MAADTQGHLRAVGVPSARIQERVAAHAVLLRLLCDVCAIRARFAEGRALGTPIAWIRAICHWKWTIVKRIDMPRFTVLPKRWHVERIFAWRGALLV